MKSQTCEMIKAALAAGLTKQGHTLQELELALANKDTDKTAELLKTSGVLDLGKILASTLWNVGKIGVGAAGLAGAGMGIGAYAGYKGLEDSRKKEEQAAALRQRIDLARQELESSQLAHTL